MKSTYNYLKKNSLDESGDYERLLDEVGEAWNDDYRPDSAMATRLVLALLKALTQDQSWSTTKRIVVLQEVQKACTEQIRAEQSKHRTRAGEINQQTFALVKPHLNIAGPSVEKNTPKFAEALRAYLEDPTDTTGMRLANLILMAEGLEQNVALINSLLAMIETKDE